MAWWHRWLARLGVARWDNSTGNDVILVEHFTPRPMDEAPVLALIENLVAGLAPDSVDEATGHPLDNLINALADQWSADVQAQYEIYVSAAKFRLDQTTAKVKRKEVVDAYYQRRLLEMKVALDTALYHLGHDALKQQDEGDEDD